MTMLKIRNIPLKSTFILGILFLSGIMTTLNLPSTLSNDTIDVPKDFIPISASSYGDYIPPASGFWFINENTRIENLTAQINGSIQISSNVELEFVNCDLRFAHSYYIVISNSKNITITGLKVSACDNEVIGINGIMNCTFQNMWIRGNGTERDCMGIFGYHSRDITVLNSTFQNFGKCIYGKNWSNWLFENCLFEQTNDSICVDGELQIEDGSSNITYRNNTIRNMELDGIEIRHTTNIFISQNIFIGGVVAVGITLGSSNIYVENNTFIDCANAYDGISNAYVANNDYRNSWLSAFNCSHSMIEKNWFDYAENISVQTELPSVNLTSRENYFRFVSPTTTSNNPSNSTEPSTTSSEPDHNDNNIDGIDTFWILGIIMCSSLILVQTSRSKKRIIS